MEGFLRWYAGWLWQGTDLDALVLRPPLSAPDEPLAFARELYHRYYAHLVTLRIWRLEWYALGAGALAALVLWILGTAVGGLPFVLGIILALLAIAAAVYFSSSLFAMLLSEADLAADKAAAAELVRRVCLRDVPKDTPADLADPWRHGWITADGRPVAAEIAEFDLRSTEMVSRTRSMLHIVIAVGLVPLALAHGVIIVLVVLLFIAWRKRRRDLPPPLMRARLLDAAAAGTAEGAAWAMAGASNWTGRIEEARKTQLVAAIADKTPILTLGTSLGVMAARGDLFAPSRGLDMALSLADLMQHLLVLGGTGSGKTAGVLRPLCKQLGDLEGIGLVVLDGKGALPGEVARFVPDLAVIEPAGKAMSLVEGLTPTEIVATVTDILGQNDKDRFWQDSAAALMRYAAVLARQDGGASWTLTGIWRIASEGPSPDVLEKVDQTIPEQAEAVAFFRTEWPAVEDKVKSSILATLRAWYTAITGHPDTLRWANTAPGGSEVDIASVLRGGRIGILAPAHRYGTAGPVVMALLKARIFAAVRDRADRGMAEGETPVVIVMDEAQDITTQQDALILGIARSLSLAIVAATQTVEGVEARLNEREAARYLTLFGSVLALQNRSVRTASMIASRIGASFRPLLEHVPGVPTVRGAVTAQRATGRLAAAKTQPLVASTVMVGEGSTPVSLLATINPFQLFRRTAQGEQERPSSRIGAAPLVTPEELTELVVEPDTAFAVLTRGRVPRRDVIKLTPMY